MIHIPDNNLLLFWYGINVSNLRGDAVRLDVKEYYQLEAPLFAGPGLSLRCNAECNNYIITQIECREKLQLQELRNNPCCAFLSIAKKPMDEAKNRQGYSFRISVPSDGDLAFLKRMMVEPFHVPPKLIERLFDVTSVIQNRRNYNTHPISGAGFCVKDSEHAYIQLYITNNRDTSAGKINRLDIDEVFDNTYLLLKSFGFRCSESEMHDLIKSMYSQEMFAAFYGLDISDSGIEKVKVYFRTTRSLDFDILCQTLKELLAQYGKCADLPCWDTVQKTINSKERHYIDCIAIAFKESDGRLAVDGVQFYLAP